MRLDTTYMTVKKVEEVMKFLKKKHKDIHLISTGGKTYISFKA